ncbi:MAG: hypothetical protein V3V99_02300 [candidate division Zixibacteria bacterium]
MRKIFNAATIFSTIFFVILSASAHSGSIGISAEISNGAIAFEQKDTLVIQLTWEGEPSLYQIDNFPIPELDKFQILGSSSTILATPTDSASNLELTTRKFVYILEPTDYGTGVIHPLSLNATNTVTGEIQPLQTSQLMVEIAKPVPKEESDNTVLLIVIAVVMIIGIAVIAYFYIKRSKERDAEVRVEDRFYITSMGEIKKDTVADKKLFYSRTYRLLINYLEKELNLEVSSKTGEEIIAKVQELDDSEDKTSLIAWLELLQKEKYSPVSPSPGEVEELYQKIYRFFENKLSK